MHVPTYGGAWASASASAGNWVPPGHRYRPPVIIGPPRHYPRPPVVVVPVPPPPPRPPVIIIQPPPQPSPLQQALGQISGKLDEISESLESLTETVSQFASTIVSQNNALLAGQQQILAGQGVLAQGISHLNTHDHQLLAGQQQMQQTLNQHASQPPVVVVPGSTGSGTGGGSTDPYGPGGIFGPYARVPQPGSQIELQPGAWRPGQPPVPPYQPVPPDGVYPPEAGAPDWWTAGTAPPAGTPNPYPPGTTQL